MLAKKQAVMNALITKKMDPKKQGQEVAEAIIRSIKLFGEVVQNDPKRIEDAEFMDQYEDLWTRFSKLGPELAVPIRAGAIDQLQKLTQEDVFYYTKCYSQLNLAAFGYIQCIALINED